MNKDLIEQYKQLHKSSLKYGGIGASPYKQVAILKIAKELGIKTLLDFGCGKGKITKFLINNGFDCTPYDPAITEFQEFPHGQYDMVFSLDVFEHLDDGWEDEMDLILSCFPKYIYLNIGLKPAATKLLNGRNAHTLIKTKEQWETLLKSKLTGYSLMDASIGIGAAKAVSFLFQKK